MKGNPVKGRFLLVARTIPKEAGGTMIILRRLLDNFDEKEVIVLGRTPHKPAMLANDKDLHYPVVEIPFPYWKGFRFWRILSIPIGIIIGLRMVLSNDIKTIVGIYPDMGSLSIAYFVSVLSRKPLLPYFCDLYAENQKKGFHGYWANWLQKKVFRKAKTVLALTEGMQELYEKRYGINVVNLPTAINDDIPDTVVPLHVTTPFIIGYSGSVVKDRYDPLQALVAAVGDDSRFEIRLFTPQKKELLQNLGIMASNVHHQFCSSQRELMEALKQCHLLYLPLTFKTGKGFNSVEQLSTCFGTKCYEYFLSARPILSHCPSDYFTSTFFTKNDCGYTLYENKPQDILQALEIIVVNYSERGTHLAQNALITARQFKGGVLANRFTNALNQIIAHE